MVSNPIDITLSNILESTSVTATVTNTSGVMVSGKLHFALIERHIPYLWQSMNELDFVLRDMLPDANGEDITLAPDQTINSSRAYTIQPGWNPDECRMVVFFQAADKEIYQGAEIQLEEDPHPSITSHPQGDAICLGDTRELSVTASGMGPFNYQWYQGNSGDTSTPVGTNSSSFTTPALMSTTKYWVRVSNAYGSDDSSSATLTVVSGPEIIFQPPNRTITEGESAGLFVTASGSSLGYQWYEGVSGDDSNPIPSATSDSYTTPPLYSTTSYWVRVTGDCGEVDSSTATVTVNEYCEPPVITGQPYDQVAFSGQTALLEVSATGTDLSYQWFEKQSDGSSILIESAIENSYVTPELTMSTQYWVKIQNNCGTVDSETVTVNVPTSGDNVWYAAHVASNTYWQTWLYMVERSETPGPVYFFAISAEGDYVSTFLVEDLASNAGLRMNLDDMFPGTKDVGDIWLMIYSETEINGVTVFGTRDNETLVTIPFYHSGAQELIFPYVYVSEEWYTGMTLVNTENVPATASLEAYDEYGGYLATSQVIIQPYGKYVRLLEGVFPLVEHPNDIRFVRVSADRNLVGFELFGSHIDKGLAGLPAFSPSRDLLVKDGRTTKDAFAPPGGFQGWALSSTEIHLVWNQRPGSNIQHYNIYEETGQGPLFLASVDNAGFTVNGLIPETTYGFSVTAVNGAEEESAKTSAVDVKTLAEGEMDWRHRVFYTVLPDSVLFFTGATFSNLDAQEATVYLEIYDSSGNRLAEANWPASTLAQVTREVGSYFDGGLPDGAAYMKAGSDNNIQGFELFLSIESTNPFRFDSVMGLDRGATALTFPLVMTADGWNSWIRLTNVIPAENEVTVHAYGADGTELGIWTENIAARGQVYQDLSEIFPDVVNDIVSLTVEARDSIIGNVLYISGDFTRMSGYMGLPVEVK